VIDVMQVNHHDPAVAAAIHAVQIAAYTQEARLLGARHFPPLERTIRDIQISTENYFAAFDNMTLVGVISFGPDEDPGARNITSLVVHPDRQQEGIASILLHRLIENFGADPMTVQTAAKNLPALALYAKFGFVECKRWSVGAEALELVRLHRPGPSNK
jgi:ribosomal protein S18 acetylase RimI-like enzyme